MSDQPALQSDADKVNNATRPAQPQLKVLKVDPAQMMKLFKANKAGFTELKAAYLNKATNQVICLWADTTIYIIFVWFSCKFIIVLHSFILHRYHYPNSNKIIPSLPFQLQNTANQLQFGGFFDFLRNWVQNLGYVEW